MKLNLWQWIGLIIMILAGGVWLMERNNDNAMKELSAPAATLPTTQPTP